jgi:hypothetical protein
MSEIFGKIFGKDKHGQGQSKDKEKSSAPAGEKGTPPPSAAASSSKSTDFCKYCFFLSMRCIRFAASPAAERRVHPSIHPFIRWRVLMSDVNGAYFYYWRSLA